MHPNIDLLSARAQRPMIAGILAVVAGIVLEAGVAYALFGPTHETAYISSSGVRTGVSHHSLVDEGVDLGAGVLIGAFAVAGLALVAIGASGSLGRRARRQTQPALWLLAALVTIGASLTMLTVGWLMMPGALLALIAAALWNWTAGRGETPPG